MWYEPIQGFEHDYLYCCPKLNIIFTTILQIKRPFYVFKKKIASDFFFFINIFEKNTWENVIISVKYVFLAKCATCT